MLYNRIFIAIFSGTSSGDLVQLANLLKEYNVKVPIVTYRSTKAGLPANFDSIVQFIPGISLKHEYVI